MNQSSSQQHPLMPYLSQLPLFKGVRADYLNYLAQHATQSAFKAGQVIQKKGSSLASLTLITQGQARIQFDTGAKDELIQAGQLIGEELFLLGQTAEFQVTAVTDGSCLNLPGEAIKHIMTAFPNFTLYLGHVCSMRLRQALQATSKKAPSETVSPPSTSGQYQFVETSEFSPSAEDVKALPKSLIRKHHAIPLRVTESEVYVGMVNPKSVLGQKELKQVFGRKNLTLCAITEDDFRREAAKHRISLDSSMDQARSGGRIEYISNFEEKSKSNEDATGIVDKLLVEGIASGASDIHIEPDLNAVRVRYRVNGSLRDLKSNISLDALAPIVARIKAVADMDTTERRLPQDGHILAKIGQNEINFRVSTIPSARGEKVVLRILAGGVSSKSISSIYVHPKVQEYAAEAINAPFGAIVVAGGTGAGKSSSLYSFFDQRKKQFPDNSLVTVEDPVEHMESGVTQISVNPRIGLEFSNVLKSLLRQDPDVIMVGELRDATTTQLTMEAALTGHLVLTTIHGNNVNAVLQRLESLGCDKLLLSQSMNAIFVQRLIRKLCNRCLNEEEIQDGLFQSLVQRKIIKADTPNKFYRANGCKACENSGFQGRIVAAESLKLNQKIRQQLAGGADAEAITSSAYSDGSFVPYAEYLSFLLKNRYISPEDAVLSVSN